MTQYQCLIVDCNDSVRGIESIDADDNDEALRKALAQSILDKSVEKSGKAKIQDYILNLEAMTPTQKEIIEQSGFNLPEQLEIIGQ